VLAPIGALTAVSLTLALRLQLNMGFDSMLPESRPSVEQMHKVSSRIASLSTVFVVLEGQNPEGLRQAADAAVPALQALGPPWIGDARDGIQDATRFLQPRAGLFVSKANLEKVQSQIEARYRYEVGQRSGMLVGLDESPPPPLNATEIERELGANREETQRYPGGYFQSQDGKTVVIAARSGFLSTDFANGQETLRRVEQAIEQVNPQRLDPAAHWGLSGDLAMGIAQYRMGIRDLTHIGLVGALVILAAVFLYYLRLRTVLAMALTIGVGLAWTFGLTELLLGHLNLATGFLFSIIAGNGINYSIIYMGRYLEERRAGAPPAAATAAAMRTTWLPTLTAAVTASVAYGALAITEFKGFHEFGIIGGLGMVVCWVATYLALPAIMSVTERVAPLELPRGSGLWGTIVRATAEGIPFGRPFALAVARFPGAIALTGALLAVVGAAATIRHIQADPMEYDFRKVQADERSIKEEHRLFDLAVQITHYVGLDGMAVLTDRVDQVEPLKAALLAKRDAAPADAKPFKAVFALQDDVPSEQAGKIPVLLQIKRRLLDAHRRGFVPAGDWERISPYLPPDDLKPFGVNDLPESLARPFTEADGTRGRVVYISPLGGAATEDAHYLRRWADSFRRTVLPDGSVILGSGRAVVYSDTWDAILADAPPAMLLSFVGTVAVIALAFRRRHETAEVLLALLVGVAWMTGALALMRMKMNFLNFVALPITFGIGVDYAVNVVLRERDTKDPVEVLRRTGGAVVLCSLTTLLGYLVLVRSVNFAVRSLGVAAVCGEISCMLAAVLFLPAALLWWRRRHSAAAPSRPPTHHPPTAAHPAR
jgi:predicted RND superfamily exporter protein